MVKALEKIVYFCLIGIAFLLPLSSGAVNTLIGIGMACWIVKMVISKKADMNKDVLTMALFLFLAAAAISIFNSSYPKESVRGLIKVLKYMGIYFIFSRNIKDSTVLRRVVFAMMGGAAIACLDGLFQYITGKDLLRSNPLIINVGLKRMTAAFSHCNDLGVYLVTVAGPVLAFARYEMKGRTRPLWYAAAILLTLCAVLTFSRGAALAFYGAAFLIAGVKKDKVILILLIVSLLAMPFLLPSGVREWGKTTHSFLEFFCNSDRIAFYRSAIQMIKTHPVIGVGVNTFSKVYHVYKVHDVDIITGETCYAHNNYLQMAGEIGLAGLGIFMFFVLAVFWRLRKIYVDTSREAFVRNCALGLAAGILAFLLNGLTESSFYFSKIVVLFWFVAGLAVSLRGVEDPEAISK
jgi:putative inorganic carbon (hco3(-)) transporter